MEGALRQVDASSSQARTTCESHTQGWNTLMLRPQLMCIISRHRAIYQLSTYIEPQKSGRSRLTAFGYTI